jgi:hypothetical protein
MSNKDNIRKWVEALRSGKYQQTTGALCRDGKYCCLGVACEVAIENGVLVVRRGTGENVVRYDSREGVLPWAVLEWLGIDEKDPELGKSQSMVASDWNDHVRADFTKIADLIEETYL